MKSSRKFKNRKPKIAIFHCGFIYTGGGERIVLEEILGLRKRGYEVDCYVPTYDSTLSYPDIIEDFGIKTFLPQLPKSVPLRFATQMVASCILAPILAFRFNKYDIFLGANQPGAYMAWVISKILGKPYFVYLSQPNRVLYPRDHEDWQNVRDYYFLDKVINKIFRKPVEILDKRSITGSKELFINGKFVAKEINLIYKPKSWMDCPGGAHPSSVRVLNLDRFNGKVRIDGYLIDKPYILFTSRHEPWKKFDWAIEVTKKVVKKVPQVKLVIPGAANALTPKLKKFAKEQGIAEKVIFTGKINQSSLWKLYQNAAVYIFTSPKEDLGIVVQEAQAAGVPVVAWDSGGPTVTVDNRKTGFLIKPYDKDKMAQKIIYLMERPLLRDRMGKDAWKHIKMHFSWEKHVDTLEKVFLQHI